MMTIKEILIKLLDNLKEMSAALDSEKEILMKDEASKLSSIVDKKKELARNIALLENERQKQFGNIKAEELISKKLIDKKDIDELKELIKDIKEKNELNMMLTKQSLNYIRVVKNAINPYPPVVTYKTDGKVDDSSRSGIFNTTV